MRTGPSTTRPFRLTLLLASGSLVLGASCSLQGTAEAIPTDGGDAGPTDSGPLDAGALDSGVFDAGTTDAGPSDAGVVDAGRSSLALSVRGSQFVLSDGGVVDARGAASCCGGGYGWPLYDEAWADLVASKGGNFLHMRVGPFRTEGNGETDWAPVGGGYVEAAGKADLSQFNPVFWTRVRALLQYARDRQLYVEVDVIDGWSLKHCQAGDIPGYSAWDSAFNVQQANGCGPAGKGAISPGSLAEQWVRKVVAETGGFDNVLYQDGNELGLVQGYSPAWTRSMHDLIRAEEQARGFVRHPFATNSDVLSVMQSPEVDYLEFHQSTPLTAGQCLGKPCLVNEYNPSPALTPAQFRQRFCAARQQGTSFWYWRHDQTEDQMLESLTQLGQPCN